MNNKIKPELPAILNNYKFDKIGLKRTIDLLNQHFYINLSTPLTCVKKRIVEKKSNKKKSDKFECEFRTIGNKVICKNYTCIASCYKKMKMEIMNIYTI